MSFRERNKDFRLSYDNRYTQPRIGTELRNLTLLEYTGSLYLSGNSGINGTLYVRDNIGIGTSSPNNKLHVNGVIQVGSTGGTYAAGVLGYTDSNWGFLYRPPQAGAQGAHLFEAFDGTDIVVFEEGGNVGIGTSSPSEVLDVVGNAEINGSVYLAAATTETRGIDVGRFRTGNGSSYVDLIGDATYADYGARFIRNNTGANAESEIYHRGTGNFNIKLIEAADFTIRTSNTERMRIDDAGNVGIGTTSPASLLHLSSTSPKIQLTDTSTNADCFIDADTSGGSLLIQADQNNEAANSLIRFDIDGSAKMTIQNDGQVGIGTTSPDTILHTYKGNSGASPNSSTSLTIEDDATAYISFLTPNTATSGFLFGDPESNQSGFITFNHSTETMSFGASASTKMALSGNGNFGIGTTSPQYTLDVNGDIYVRGQTIVFSSGGLSNMDYIQYNDGGITGLNTAGGYGFFADTTLSTDLTNATACIACKGLYSAGNVGINTSSPSTKLHVAGDTGTVPSLTADTQLVINNSSAAADNVTMSLIAGTSGTCTLYFGDSAAEIVGRISYNNSTSLLSMTYGPVPDQLAFNSTGLKVGGTGTASEKLDVEGDAIRIRTSQTPASAAATGTAGTICWDSDYIYVCVAANTWKRVAIAW